MDIIAREVEQSLLAECYEDNQPHFVVVYGRRRVGKTFLVREFFKDRFCLRFTGIANAGKMDQLQEFNVALRQYGQESFSAPDNWFEAFDRLRTLIEQSKIKGKKVVFLDEMPWIDTHKSKFLQAFEHFWNGWASGRVDLLLIVCGSATAWITNKLFRNRGGLHNRVTRQIYLCPFTLRECEAYFRSRNIALSRYQILESYMIFGGIPYYLSLFRKEKRFSQCNAHAQGVAYDIHYHIRSRAQCILERSSVRSDDG
jgi:predicted AAA+ superfamily ATPase